MSLNGPSFSDPSDNEADGPPLAKTTLFCRVCGHASRLDGDWLVTDGPNDHRVVCPECDTVVVAQPGLELLA